MPPSAVPIDGEIMFAVVALLHRFLRIDPTLQGKVVDWLNTGVPVQPVELASKLNE